MKDCETEVQEIHLERRGSIEVTYTRTKAMLSFRAGPMN